MEIDPLTNARNVALITKQAKQIAELEKENAALRAAADESREKAKLYHRRAQQAEAACVKFKKQWDEHGGPRGGSFGRALLASACESYTDEIESLKEALRGFVNNSSAQTNLPHECEIAEALLGDA